MKNIFIILFTIVLLLPIYAQQTEPNEINGLDENVNKRGTTGGNEYLADEEQYEKQDTEFGDDLGPMAKKPFYFARRYFELGYDLGVGVDNGLIGTGDLFKENVEIDMSKLEHDIGKNGAGFNFDIFGGFFINVMNIPIKGGIWDFGVSGATDGGINFNLPHSLFKLIAEGNIKQHSSSGTISASGGIYGNIGVNASAKYESLKLGVKPALYTPLLFIPKSGITYHLNAEEKLSLEAEGAIVAYSPFIENGELQFGFDLSLEGEYALFAFLDVGGSLSHIPLAAARLENGMRLTLDKIKYEVDLHFEEQDSPELDFTQDNNYRNTVKVYRPLRFDVYARYKPFNTEYLVVKPNMGFTVDINDQEGYFNAGVEGQINLKDLFIARLGTGYQETIWKHRLGFALNLRAFELDLEGSLRSQNFIGSFKGQGFGLDIGMRFGW